MCGSNQMSLRKSLSHIVVLTYQVLLFIDREQLLLFFFAKKSKKHLKLTRDCYFFFVIEFLNRLPLSLVSVCHGRNDDASSATAAATRLERHGMSL